eukprot:2072168-Rhodomonas_salina.1
MQGGCLCVCYATASPALPFISQYVRASAAKSTAFPAQTVREMRPMYEEHGDLHLISRASMCPRLQALALPAQGSLNLALHSLELALPSTLVQA